MTAVASSLLDPGNRYQRSCASISTTATIYQAGAVVAPEGWTVEWSTDDGATWVAVEPTPASSVTNVRATATVEAGNVRTRNPALHEEPRCLRSCQHLLRQHRR